MKKLTCKKVKEMIRDEDKGSNEYRAYGLKGLAKDESRHSRMLKKKMRRLCK